MKPRISSPYLIMALALGAVFFLSACKTAPHPDLVAARDAYNEAAAQPDVEKYAPVELYDAKKMIQRAEKAEDEEEIADLAGLAKDRVEVAVLTAQTKKAREKKLALEEETQKTLLKSRQIEIDKAKKEAEEKAAALSRKAEEARAAELALAVKAKEAEQKAAEAARAKAEAQASQQKAAAMKAEAEAARATAEAATKEAEAATKEMENLKKQLAELQAKQTDRGLVLTLGDVLFATGKSDLMPGAARSLDKLVAFLQENPDRNILIEGHTDSTGSDSANLALSRRRADSVRGALMVRGVNGNRIATTGYGEAYPVADNGTRAGRQQNRRVEITILEKGVKGESMMRR
ncbi:MAG: flagellar motor protein MotB [Desulfobacterales bacterium]|nr:MAG: flagellar motor protein MotB [Desulfobacterales bacterium]